MTDAAKFCWVVPATIRVTVEASIRTISEILTHISEILTHVYEILTHIFDY